MISPLPLRQIGQETILIFINMKHLFHSLLAVAFVLCAGFQQAVAQQMQFRPFRGQKCPYRPIRQWPDVLHTPQQITRKSG